MASNELSIHTYLHCGLCLDEWKTELGDGMAPRDYGSVEIGFTREGIQIWCKRHECNVAHIDFEGKSPFPTNTSRKIDA